MCWKSWVVDRGDGSVGKLFTHDHGNLGFIPGSGDSLAGEVFTKKHWGLGLIPRIHVTSCV